ncbi:MAG: endonuclease/exonuclease/phosphatase family protein [Methylobacterium frigidaeris]
MLRLVTYNVRRCLGTDGQLSPARIAQILAACRPDVVALQELDVGRLRTGGVDQAHAIAAHLGMTAHFHAALRVLEEEYGDAILTALPSRLVRAEGLPGPPGREPRGALWAAVAVAGAEIQVVNTHLGLGRRERLAQAEALLGPRWLGDPACAGPVALVGDFNAVPGSRVYRRLAARLTDAHRAAPSRTRGTFPSRLPLLRLDHIFVTGGIEVVRAETFRGPGARVASDHLPLVADLRLGRGAGAAAPGGAWMEAAR